MAAAKAANCVQEDRYSCPICLEIYEKPMTISCGHTFCNNCLAQFNSVAEPLCPLCRSVFHPPLKQKNYTLEKQIAAQKAVCEGCAKRMSLGKLRSHRVTCAPVQAQPAAVFRPPGGTSQPVPMNLPNRSTFKCPYCGLNNLDCTTLRSHCNDVHGDSKMQVVCPICAAMPWGNPDQKSANFIAHLNMRHQFEYDTFVDYEQDDEAMLQLALKASLEQM